ncbi:MAG: hypothetical protein R6X02_20030 [Enhygromyxa sp.]
MGEQILAELIPAPAKAGTCDCDDIGQGNNCCYEADGPPEFWYYPFEGSNVFPGDSILLPLANPQVGDYYFELFQAQRIHSCESPNLELSWAVVAKP